MDFRHSILIYHLPKSYIEDAVKSITELTTISEKSISLMKPDHWGAKIILDNEQNFRKVVSLCVLHVHNKTYSLYSLVTDLIVCGTGAQIDALEVELLLERFAPVLIVYEVKNQHGAITFRAALNYPEIPEIIQLWTGTKLKISGYDGTEFSISSFCRFCRENGHFKSQCRKRQIPVEREAFGKPSPLRKNDNDKQGKKASKPRSDDQQHRNMQNFPLSPYPPLCPQPQVQPDPPAFGKPSALKKNDNDKQKKKALKPRSDDQQHRNMQNFPPSPYPPLCPQPQVQPDPPAFGKPSALKKNDNDKQKKKALKPRSDDQQHRNMQNFPPSPYPPLCPQPQVQPDPPAFGKPSALKKNDNDKQKKKALKPLSDDQQHRNMQNFPPSPYPPLCPQPQVQPDPPAFGKPSALKKNDNDKQEKKESTPQSDDQQNMQNFPPSPYPPLCPQPQVQPAPPSFGRPSALKKNDNDKQEKKESTPQSDDQQNMQNFPPSPYPPLCPQPQVQPAPPSFGRPSALKKNDNDKQEKKESTPQSDDQQHRNIQNFPHSPYPPLCPQPQVQPAPPSFGRPSALKKNDNDKQEKKESTPQSDDQQNMQNFPPSPYPPLCPQPQVQPAPPSFGRPSALKKNDNDKQEKKESTPQSDDQQNMQNFPPSPYPPLCPQPQVQPAPPSFGRPSALKKNDNDKQKKKALKPRSDDQQHRNMQNFPPSPYPPLCPQPQVQPDPPAFGKPSALKKNDNDKQKKKALKPRSDDQQHRNMQNFPPSPYPPLCPQPQVQPDPPAFGKPSALKKNDNDKQKKKALKPLSDDQQHRNMQNFPPSPYPPLCPQPQVQPDPPAFGKPSALKKNDNDKQEKKESTPQSDDQQNMQNFPPSPYPPLCPQPQVQPAPPSFGRPSALKKNDNDKQEKKESTPQSDDQQNMQNFPPSPYPPLCPQPQVQPAPPSFGRPSALKKNDNDKQEKKESTPQSDDQQHRNIQNFPHSPYPPLCPQPQVQPAPPSFGRPSALKKNDNDKQEKKESTPQSDDQQHRNMQNFPHSPYPPLCPQPQVQPAPPALGRPSALKKNDNDKHEKKESTPQSDDQQNRNMQNFSHSPYPPLCPQIPQYPQYGSSPNAPPLLPYTHVTSGFPSLPNCKVTDKYTTAVASSDSSTGFGNFVKESSDSSTELANFAKGSSDSSAVCRNDSDMNKKSVFEATSSKPLSPSTNLKHLIPPTMQNDIETLKLFFSHCKSFKHLYKSALRYPAGIGALLRQLRKILKFNKNIKTKSEEEMKFIAWICLLLSKLQYFHLKKNIQLEKLYVPPL